MRYRSHLEAKNAASHARERRRKKAQKRRAAAAAVPVTVPTVAVGDRVTLRRTGAPGVTHETAGCTAVVLAHAKTWVDVRLERDGADGTPRRIRYNQIARRVMPALLPAAPP